MGTVGSGAGGRGAVFVLPGVGRGRSGPVAAWVTTGGWASGAERVLGAAWVLSDEGVFAPAEAMSRAAVTGAAPAGPPRRWRRMVPEPVITLVKDVRRAAAARDASLATAAGPWDGRELAFVWQRHELFRTCGFRLARRLGVPVVLSVHALQVREARSWGVTRPGWSALAERRGELPQLRAADVVACVSEEVAAQVTALGVDGDRVLVTPNGVDLGHFRPRPEAAALRARLGLGDRFVVGWSGSFRGFHGLDQALESMALLQDERPEIALLLIGDGLQRPRLEARARELGLRSVRFIGAVPYEDMPAHLSACDAGLVLAPAAGAFHYSPVKLREYMACGLPVVAHAAGELESVLRDRVDALVVPRGSPAALAAALRELATDPALAARLGAHSEEAAGRWAWDKPVLRVLEALGGRRD